MNVLNLAIDQESELIVRLLSLKLSDHPKYLKQLVSNRFGKYGIMAIHQAFSKGNKRIIDELVENFEANLNDRMLN